jgi:hypothetical protein
VQTDERNTIAILGGFLIAAKKEGSGNSTKMRQLIFFSWMILGVAMLGCGPGDDQEVNALAEQKLLDRKEKFMAERMQECSRRTMSRAQAIADSILRIESKIQKFDSIPVPYDTFKPERPEIQFPEFVRPVRKSADSLSGK